MKTVNLNVVTDRVKYCQSAQDSDINFSPLKRVGPNEFSEIFHRVRCRDYLGTMLIASHFKSGSGEVYDLKIPNVEKYWMSLDETLLSLTLGEISYNNIYKKARILRNFERMMGVPREEWTKFYRTQYNGEGESIDRFEMHTSYKKCYRLVVVGSKVWVQSPLLLNFYTAALRLMTYNSEATTFDKLLEDLEDRVSDTDKSNVNFLKNIIPYRILLKNYKYILQDDPLTGLDDNSQKVRLGFSSGAYQEMSFRYKDYNIHVYYNTDSTQANSGILSLLGSVNLIRKNPNSPLDYLNKVGAKWIINLLEVMKNEKS